MKHTDSVNSDDSSRLPSDMGHTPTPYYGNERDLAIYDSKGNPVALVRALDSTDPKAQATKAFIVQACNAHAGLVEALTQAQAALRTISSRIDRQGPDLGAYAHKEAATAYEALRSATP